MRTAVVERLLWTLALLVVIATFAFLTLALGPIARRVPVVIVVPTLILLAIQLGLDLRALGWRRLGQENFFDRALGVPAEHQGARPREAEMRRGRKPRGRQEISMLAWLVLLPVLIVGFGELVAIPAYTLIYLKVRAKRSWLFSAGMAAAMGSLTFLIIRVLLSAPPYEGQFYLWLDGGS